MGHRNHTDLPARVPDWSAPMGFNAGLAIKDDPISSLLLEALQGHHEYPELLNLVVDRNKKEISFNGARVAPLKKLIYFVCIVSVYLPGRDPLRTHDGFKIQHPSATLKEGCLLTCYTLLYPDSIVLPTNNRLFLLSSSYDEFVYEGFCLVDGKEMVRRLGGYGLPQNTHINQRGHRVLDAMRIAFKSTPAGSMDEEGPKTWKWAARDPSTELAISSMLDIMFERLNTIVDRRINVYLDASESERVVVEDTEIEREMFWCVKEHKEGAGTEEVLRLSDEFVASWIHKEGEQATQLHTVLCENSSQGELTWQFVEDGLLKNQGLKRVNCQSSHFFFNQDGGMLDLWRYGRTARCKRLRLRPTGWRGKVFPAGLAAVAWLAVLQPAPGVDTDCKAVRQRVA
ncbi:hypothetical protein QBC38DRAFT_45600 [Podospora fimiseda]|uniref:Uncharacterized protein n=1 Tax=Podospora fimiseda TaxID=252190 RepID=A0AAN7BHZ1_9PEZI|nr:hypothetical protein QBC38DRAFT_45600 [Podospora fimiseda]